MSKELTLGGSDPEKPEGIVFKWSGPAEKSPGSGFIWLHTKPMTNEDFMFFRQWLTHDHAMGGMVFKAVPEAEFDADPWRFIDKKSIVGKWHPDYTTSWVENAGSEELKRRRKRNAGGRGSTVYEDRNLRKAGIKGKMPEPKYRPGGNRHRQGFWYKNKDGELVKGIPPENSGLYYHEDSLAHEGAKADPKGVLERKKIVWDEADQSWALVDK